MSNALFVALAKSVADLREAFATLSRQPGPAGKAGTNGTDGKDGVDGKDGKRGLAGKDGKDGTDGKDGKRGPAGKNGKDGVDGKDGERGPMPNHRWRGTKLQFEKPDGAWGKLVDLEGPKGEPGTPGSVVIGGSSGGGGLDPSKIEQTDTVLTGDEMLILRDGVVLRVAIALDPGGEVPANAVTVNGVAVTVNGQYVVKT